MEIPTGIVISIPVGMIGLIHLKPEVGAFMYLRNSFVIDNNYRSEIKLSVFVDNANHNIKPYDMIADLVILPTVKAEFKETHHIGAMDPDDT